MNLITRRSRKGFWRLLCPGFKIKNSARNVVSADTHPDPVLPHIYSKTWTKNELIQYIKNNVVYETDYYIATSVPFGIALKKTSRWLDTVHPLACDSDLNEIMKELPQIFNVESLFLTVNPTRNSSGLVIFSKSLQADNKFKSLITDGSLQDYIFSFLAVVLGLPSQSLTQEFAVKTIKMDNLYGTEILEVWSNLKKLKKINYNHEVLSSSEHVSLVQFKMSNNVRNCGRHILATKCTTPVLGDYYNYVKRKSSLFGTPVTVDPSIVKDNPQELDPELLAKLQLKSGDEKLIPIHLHLESIKVPLKKNEIFFAFAPPTESFVWTCQQLGLNEIDLFGKIK